MIGVIMAGGKGTRLYPLTANRPKPLVEVLGKPVIDYVNDALLDAGVKEVILTTGYQGEGLVSLVKEWNQQKSGDFSVNNEARPMGTAGSVKLLQDKLTDTFIVASGDAILSSDLKKLISAHKVSKSKVTMALWEVEDPTQFGIVGLSSKKKGQIEANLSEGYITKFLEKPSLEDAFSNVINAGLYIIEPEVLEHIPFDTKYDFSKDLFPKLLGLGWPLYAKKLDGLWFDVGTPSELVRAQNELIVKRLELPFKIPSGEITDDGGYIFDKANSQSRVIKSVLCDQVLVGENCEIEDSLIMNNSEVGDYTKIKSSVIGNNVTIGSECSLVGCVVGDNVSIKDKTNLVNLQVDS
ncbi:MAG: NDP-sugar synthase [Candidatus Poseidoniaceae archaeon]|nr:NDP-sugar synthase [Candidatus Poseidoniaceae archaeon]